MNTGELTKRGRRSVITVEIDIPDLVMAVGLVQRELDEKGLRPQIIRAELREPAP